MRQSAIYSRWVGSKTDNNTTHKLRCVRVFKFPIWRKYWLIGGVLMLFRQLWPYERRYEENIFADIIWVISSQVYQVACFFYWSDGIHKQVIIVFNMDMKSILLAPPCATTFMRNSHSIARASWRHQDLWTCKWKMWTLKWKQLFFLTVPETGGGEPAQEYYLLSLMSEDHTSQNIIQQQQHKQPIYNFQNVSGGWVHIKKTGSQWVMIHWIPKPVYTARLQNVFIFVLLGGGVAVFKYTFQYTLKT